MPLYETISLIDYESFSLSCIVGFYSSCSLMISLRTELVLWFITKKLVKIPRKAIKKLKIPPIEDKILRIST